MTIIQGENEKTQGIYYEYDPEETPLGVGGMGRVYRGWRVTEATGDRREVAIKCLYCDLPSHVINRARREASVRLKNDSLIEMIAFVETLGKDELGQPVSHFHVVSEYLHGVTLDKILKGQITDSQGNVVPFVQEMHGLFISNPYEFAITVTRNLLSGLIALHDAGYIHRDIDPSNIMVTADGKIKLIDFGIVKKLAGNHTNQECYTVAGQFLGKPKYAAPELVRGLVDSQNPTTDLYSVGILLYQLLIGSPPFDGEMAEVLEMQLSRKMPLSNVKQKQIRGVIETATQKKRIKRYQSAAEFRVAIDGLAALPYPAKSTGRKIFMAAGGVVALAALAIGIVALVKSQSAEKQEKEILAMVESDGGEQSPDQKLKEEGMRPGDSYMRAIRLLSMKYTAPAGLAMLERLAARNDYNSTFLLSRLYFDSREKVHMGAFSDSITLFRSNLGIGEENSKAHALLKEAVEINPNDYRALFELGCDYKSFQRGATQNPDSAYIYLERALQLATQAGDGDYIRAIQGRMSNLKKSSH